MPDLFPDGFTAPTVLTLLFGVVLLVAGRRIFWLLVGVVGFYFGFDFASRVLGLDGEGLGLLIGIFAGVIGIFLALFLQKVAIGFAGFLVGGYLAISLMGGDAAGLTGTELAAFVVGGVLCALLAVWLFEVALILLSAIAGAGLIVESVGSGSTTALLGFLVLVVIGIAIQSGIGPKKGRRRLRARG